MTNPGGTQAGRGPERRSASAAWAVLGKREGSRLDYNVLAALRNRTDFFDEQIRDYLPGNPVDPLQPPPAPYYVFWPGPTTHQGVATLNCSRTELTKVRDGTSRESLRLAFFNLRLSDIHEDQGGAAGYTDLAHAMDRRSASMPKDPGEFARMNFHAAALAAAREGAELCDFDWLATGAAAVLAGRVVISGAQHVGVADRLRCLDAIGALLPYGARARLSAATFARGNGMHAIRLFFDDLTPEGAFELPWRGPASEPPSAVGRDYRDLLLRQHAATGPATLFSALLSTSQPRSLHDPQSVLDVAERVLRPHADITARFRDAVAAAARARLLLERQREAPPLGEDEKALWWQRLLADPGTRPRHLHALAWTPDRQHLDTLARGLLALLPSPGGVDTALWYCELADGAGLPGELPARLVRSVDQDESDTLRALLAVLTHSGLTAVPATAVAAALGDRKRLLFRLWHADSSGTLKLLTALSGHVPDTDSLAWLRPFRALLHDGPAPNEDDIWSARRNITGFVELLTETARRRRPEREADTRGWLAPVHLQDARAATRDAADAALILLRESAAGSNTARIAEAARTALEFRCASRDVVDELVLGFPERGAPQLDRLLRDVAAGRTEELGRLRQAALRQGGALDRLGGATGFYRHLKDDFASDERRNNEELRELARRKCCLRKFQALFRRPWRPLRGGRRGGGLESAGHRELESPDASGGEPSLPEVPRTQAYSPAERVESSVREYDAARRVADRPRDYAIAVGTLLSSGSSGNPPVPHAVDAGVRDVDTVTSLLPRSLGDRLHVTTPGVPVDGMYVSPLPKDHEAPRSVSPDPPAGSYASILVQYIERAPTYAERVDRVLFLTRGLRTFQHPLDPDDPRTPDRALECLREVLQAWRERPYEQLLAVLGRKPDAVRREADALIGATRSGTDDEHRSMNEALVDVVREHFSARHGHPWAAVPHLLCLAGIAGPLDTEVARAVLNVRAVTAQAPQAPDDVQTEPLRAGDRFEAALLLLDQVFPGDAEQGVAVDDTTAIPAGLVEVLLPAFHAEAERVLPGLAADVERGLDAVGLRNAELILTRHSLRPPRPEPAEGETTGSENGGNQA
ncbi:hypothetical protein ACFZAD_21065 [Streptomyces iakyrus]|uniref:hypothetical protein n=1 Tax=Streptomyces iakyrus TaxID=68219 RepID=UPI0036EB3726